MNGAQLATVPVIDLSGDPAWVEAEVTRACADWGFFHIVGHGLEAGLVSSALAEARAFFAAPAEAKRALARNRDNPWGYNDRELTKQRRDKKQIFDIGPDAAALKIEGDVFSGATPFPEWQPGLQTTMRAWFEACEALCMRLLRPVATGLGAGRDALVGDFDGAHTSFLRLNHYPIGDLLADDGERDGAGPAGLGIHPHADAGALTILLTDGNAGLQVLKDGDWRPVNPVPGGLIVNIGDMAQVWSNDRYPAPLHRVLAMENHERLSLAYFFNPAYPAVIRPLASTLGEGGSPHYRDLPWAEFRRRRADGDYADYGAEVQISDYRLG
jgi:isopenicillin N synthase-like dioxygenase